MANIVLTKANNWSTCSNGANTGNAPGASDNIFLNGQTLTLDGGNDSTYTCGSISGTTNGATASAGQVTSGNAKITIAGNIVGGNDNMISLASKNLTINGNVTNISTRSEERRVGKECRSR